MLCVLCTIVVKWLVVCADLLVYLVHIFNNNFRYCIVVLVAGLSCLEEDVVVLSCTSCYRVLRVKCSSAERFYCVPIKHICEIRIIPLFNLLNLVRGSETVKEVEERNSALDSRKMCNGSKIHTFLWVVWTEHCIACLTASINIWMVTENWKSVACKSTGRYMDYAR